MQSTTTPMSTKDDQLPDRLIILTNSYLFDRLWLYLTMFFDKLSRIVAATQAHRPILRAILSTDVS